MDTDTVNKRELFRLHGGPWRRKNSARRWEYMCELRDQGKTWKEMGAAIDRHWTTAHRLWQRGMTERSKAVVETRIQHKAKIGAAGGSCNLTMSD